jgi:hypothetical protein
VQVRIYLSRAGLVTFSTFKMYQYRIELNQYQVKIRTEFWLKERECPMSYILPLKYFYIILFYGVKSPFLVLKPGTGRYKETNTKSSLLKNRVVDGGGEYNHTLYIPPMQAVYR